MNLRNVLLGGKRRERGKKGKGDRSWTLEMFLLGGKRKGGEREGRRGGTLEIWTNDSTLNKQLCRMAGYGECVT